MTTLSTRIEFGDEQAMLLDAAVAFCRDKSPIATVRALMGSDTGFDPAVWREMVAMGWSGIAIPEELGGSGLTLAEVATIAEPMGRRLLAVPFAGTQAFVQGVLAGAGEARRQEWLGRIVDGAIATVGLLEEDGDWSGAAPGARAVRDGALLRLSGRKTLVCDAGVADLAMVSVELDGAPALVVLDRDALAKAGLRREGVIDETQRAWAIDLDGVSVDASSAIAGDAATASLRAIRDCSLLVAAAMAAGGTAGVLDVVVEYLNTRSAFGRKIGSYQSLKHTCAEILVGLERARSHVYHAATLLAAGEDAEVALRMAMAEAGDTFAFAGDRAVQFHGGFGFTWDCDAQLFLRRAMWLQYSQGDGDHHRRRLADLLIPA